MPLTRKIRDLCDSIEGIFSVSAEKVVSTQDQDHGRYDKGSDAMPYSGSYEEEIFYDVRRGDRICAQCGKDHSFKPKFEGVKTSIEHIAELFSLNNKDKADKKTPGDIPIDNRRWC